MGRVKGSLAIAAAYIGVVHYAYVQYLHATFAYAHYDYLTFSIGGLVVSYLLAWLPVLFAKESPHPAQSAAGLIYALAYVPIQLSLLFNIDAPFPAVMLAQSALAISMTVLFRVACAGPLPAAGPVAIPGAMDTVVGGLTIASLTVLIAVHFGHMRLVSFSDVYDLRAESGELAQGVIEGYFISWLSYCFISYLFARGLSEHTVAPTLLGATASVLLYLSTGAKASLLLLPMTLGMAWLWAGGIHFLRRLLVVLTLLIAALVLFVPDEGVYLWVKSIVLARIIGTNGWTASKYLEYFSAHGYTYYTHIGPVQGLTHAYPYGSLSLGQVIGVEYSGTEEANFNASFWASDGFAALGVPGVLVITPVVAAILLAVNHATAKFSTRFSVPWLTGLWVVMLNVPLTTAMLSGGGALLLLISWAASALYRDELGVTRRVG